MKCSTIVVSMIVKKKNPRDIVITSRILAYPVHTSQVHSHDEDSGESSWIWVNRLDADA